MVSLDGFIEGPQKELDWHQWDAEMDEYMLEFFRTVDTIILGRIAYELMADYWPIVQTENPGITHKMNNLLKIVFSKTLKKANWNNTTVLKDLVANEILRLKQEPGKDIVLLGGSTILSAFMKEYLVDEYRIILNPVILGKGNPLFKQIEERLLLDLISTRAFRCGNILLCYRSGRKQNSR